MKYFALLILAWPAVSMANRNCYAPWGGMVPDGSSVMAYYKEYPTNGERCRYEYRRCSNGYLSGSYRYQNCREDYSCRTAEFGHMQHMETVIAYMNANEYGEQKCRSEVRQCSYGRLSGSYRYRYCTEHPSGH